MKCFTILRPMKHMSDLNMSHGTYFVSFQLFEFALVIKLRNFDLKSHGNTVIFLVKKYIDVRFEHVP